MVALVSNETNEHLPIIYNIAQSVGNKSMQVREADVHGSAYSPLWVEVKRAQVMELADIADLKSVGK